MHKSCPTEYGSMAAKHAHTTHQNKELSHYKSKDKNPAHTRLSYPNKQDSTRSHEKTNQGAKLK
jgi:hypothetical protein